MRKIIVFILLFGLLFSSQVEAQSGVGLPKAGLTPNHFLYPVETFFENTVTFFTFGSKAKAKRLSKLSQERIAEIKKVEGSKKTEKVVNRYKKQFERMQEKLREAEKQGKKIVDLEAKVASSSTKHFEVLEGVLNKVPQEAQKGVNNALEASKKVHKQTLKGLAGKKPAQAAKIALREMNRQAEEIQRESQKTAKFAQKKQKKKGEEEKSEKRVQKMVQEFQDYSQFGKEISKKARGMKLGTSSVDELVEQATGHHLEVL